MRLAGVPPGNQATVVLDRPARVDCRQSYRRFRHRITISELQTAAQAQPGRMLLAPFPDVDYRIDTIVISYAATNDVANTARVVFIQKGTGGIGGDRWRLNEDMTAPDNATTVFELRFEPSAHSTALIIPVSSGDLTRTLGRGNGLFIWWTTRSGEAVTDVLTVTIHGEVTGTLRITGDADLSILDDVAAFNLPAGSYVFTWLMGDQTDDTDNCLNSLPSTLTQISAAIGVGPAAGGRFMDVVLT